MGFLVARIAQQGAELMQAHLDAFGIKARHFGVLAVLAENGPLSQQAVGDLLRIDRTTMVALVDDLEQRGLAIRRADQRDRRAYRVELSEAGRETLERADAAVTAANEQLVAPLRPADQRQLLALLRQLSRV
jgi:DNA-binding MarR family transcriptional regulator